MFWKKKLTKKAQNISNSRKTIKTSKVNKLDKLLEKFTTKIDKLDNDNKTQSNKLIILSCNLPVNKLKGKVFIKDKPYLAWCAVKSNGSNDSSNTPNSIKSLYKYRLPDYVGKLDYELKIYKLDDSRIKEIIENKFSGNNENIYNQIQSFIDSNNLTMLKKIDMKITHSHNSYIYQFIDFLFSILKFSL